MPATNDEIDRVVVTLEDHERIRNRLRGMMVSDDRDPYRPALQYFVGLLGFALALLIALISALPKSVATADTLYPAVLQTLGGALAWATLLAFAAAASALIVQWLKLSRLRAMERGTTPRQGGVLVRLLMLVSLAVALGVLYYGVVGGWAVMTRPDAATLPSLREAVCGLTQLLCT